MKKYEFTFVCNGEGESKQEALADALQYLARVAYEETIEPAQVAFLHDNHEIEEESDA